MKLLIAEDETLIALDIADVAEEREFDVLGPFSRTHDGLAALQETTPNVAIVDVNLLDGLVFPLADALKARGVPLIFHSGHSTRKEISGRYPGAMFCPKPSDIEALVETARRIARPRSAHEGQPSVAGAPA